MEVSEISRGLKILAGELETPVVALSQLSRNLEKPRRQAPHARRPSRVGRIEQDADIVMFIFREEIYDPKPENRAGRDHRRQAPLGTHRNRSARHLPQYTRFANMASGFTEPPASVATGCGLPEVHRGKSCGIGLPIVDRPVDNPFDSLGGDDLDGDRELDLGVELAGHEVRADGLDGLVEVQLAPVELDAGLRPRPRRRCRWW